MNNVLDGRLSSEGKAAVQGMQREVDEIESIGDSCYNLSRTITRKVNSNEPFTEKQEQNLFQMFDLVEQALLNMREVVEHAETQRVSEINKAFNLENEINNYRKQLRDLNLQSVNNKEYDYQTGIYYMDMVNECEKLGDYVVNVVEASSMLRDKK